MSKIKYISLEELQLHLEEVVSDVYKFNTEYVVMVDKEPKVRICSLLDGKTDKKVVVEESFDKDKKLKMFID